MYNVIAIDLYINVINLSNIYYINLNFFKKYESEDLKKYPFQVETSIHNHIRRIDVILWLLRIESWTVIFKFGSKLDFTSQYINYWESNRGQLNLKNCF